MNDEEDMYSLQIDKRQKNNYFFAILMVRACMVVFVIKMDDFNNQI